MHGALATAAAWVPDMVNAMARTEDRVLKEGMMMAFGVGLFKRVIGLDVV